MRTPAKDTFKIISVPVIIASLCCITPVVIVLFGLGSVSLAASLADTLYGGYKWLFRIVGLLLLTVSIILYLRKQKGICTLDEAKKRRNEIINIVLVSVSVAIIGYVIFLYIAVGYVGKILNIWR